MGAISSSVNQRGRSFQADLHALRRALLFQMLDRDDLGQLVTVAVWRTYKRRERIASAEDLSRYLLVIMEGQARLVRYSPQGRIITIDRLFTSESCGMPGIRGTAPLMSNLEAMAEGTKVCWLPLDAVSALIATKPQVTLRMADLLVERLVRAYDRIADLASQPVLVRLAHTLAEYGEVDPRRQASLSREELAALIGASREEVTRGLKRLHALHLITLSPHHSTIHIDNRKILAALEVELEHM